jgi:lactate dehydrogenase-like 2-hydroxyacid dehydrogenase
MRKCVVAYGQDLSELHLDALRQEFDLGVFRDPKGADRADFAEAIRGAHGLIGASVKLGKSLLSTSACLEIVSSVSAGFDNYDIDYLNSRGILLTNTPDVLTETAADTAFALLMAAARRVVELNDYIRQGRWQASVGESFFGTDVHGKRLGIIGFGRIGQAVARRGRFGFGMEILYNNRRPKEAEAS